MGGDINLLLCSYYFDKTGDKKTIENILNSTPEEKIFYLASIQAQGEFKNGKV